MFIFRYSIWLDSKMRLNTDPMLIIEFFLWRMRAEYAISNHYDRHCVWEEVLQNKRLNKYNHTAIDEQFMFYQSDGLRKFNPSDPNTPLPSCAYLGAFFISAFLFYLSSLACRELICAQCTLQMYLKVPLSSELIRQCQIYFRACGSMKLIDLPHVTN